jgi:NADH-quinone oxidoreductase subunit L
MVTAGVYMVCRLSFLYAAAPGASAVIAWVGGLTAIFAATIAINQTDIKKVLAYSTVSQLGYMFMAAGCGAYTAAMFHVVTHAFFKALLFMGAGAVIVAMHHEQDMLKMGALRGRLRRTHAVMVVGVAAIAGLPLLSGFFSKDEILLSAYLAHDIPGHYTLWAIGAVTAALTAFYMSRLLFLTFYGTSHVAPELRPEVHDPGNWIMWPLYVLAALSIVGGLVGMPQFWGDMVLGGIENSDSLGRFLLQTVVPAPEHDISNAAEWGLAGVAFAMATVGFLLAFWLYVSRPALPEQIAERLGGVYRTLANKYYVDELYDATVVVPLVSVSDKFLYRRIDAGLIDGGLVNGSARVIRGLAANGLKYVQSGLTQAYLFIMVVGALAIVGFLLR